MSMAIWKYVLNKTGPTVYEMPAGARVVSVQAQYGELTLWALVNPEISQHQQRRFLSLMTGEPGPVTEESPSLGTVQFDQGRFVVHVFEAMG
jgi:hypothetical protein